MLVTHGIGFLPQCDQIVVIVDGRITEVGTYNELLENNEAFAQFLHTFQNTDANEEENPGNYCVHVYNECVHYWDMIVNVGYMYVYRRMCICTVTCTYSMKINVSLLPVVLK